MVINIHKFHFKQICKLAISKKKNKFIIGTSEEKEEKKVNTMKKITVKYCILIKIFNDLHLDVPQKCSTINWMQHKEGKKPHCHK